MMEGAEVLLMTKNKMKSMAIDLLYDVLGSILYAAGIYSFAYHANFAPAGVSGLSIIINQFIPIPIGTMSILLNIPIALGAYRLLGRAFFLRSIKSMLISALFMDVVFPLFPAYTGSPLLAALFSGLLGGAGLCLIYMRNSSTGGTDFIIMGIRKLRPHVSIGQITLIVDGTVILLGGVVFRNIDAVLYGIISTAMTTVIIDYILRGAGAGKLAMIISDRSQQLADKISEITGRGATILHATGSFTGAERTILLCACVNSELPKIKRVVHALDPGALVVVTEYTEAFGEGFQRIEEESLISG